MTPPLESDTAPVKSIVAANLTRMNSNVYATLAALANC